MCPFRPSMPRGWYGIWHVWKPSDGFHSIYGKPAPSHAPQALPHFFVHPCSTPSPGHTDPHLSLEHAKFQCPARTSEPVAPSPTRTFPSPVDSHTVFLRPPLRCPHLREAFPDHPAWAVPHHPQHILVEFMSQHSLRATFPCPQDICVPAETHAPRDQSSRGCVPSPWGHTQCGRSSGRLWAHPSLVLSSLPLTLLRSLLHTLMDFLYVVTHVAKPRCSIQETR